MAYLAGDGYLRTYEALDHRHRHAFGSLLPIELRLVL